jgi:RNA polymerase sigma factor (TIGR02999 family)
MDNAVDASLSAVELTGMLRAWGAGDASVLERLTPVVYAELHRIAQRNLAGEREGHLLQPTALVNEAFIRLLGEEPVEWSSRTQFFGFSARLMRQILIDFARRQAAGKRGNRSPHVDLSAAGDVAANQSDPVDVIDLDQALDELAQLDARQAQIVELRFFGGMENAEIATVLGISETTMLRDWRVARAWLLDRLESKKIHEPGTLSPGR